MHSQRTAIPNPGTDLADEVAALLQSTARNLIYGIGGMYLIWHVVATATWAAGVGPRVWSVLPVVLVTSLAALRLLPSRSLVAVAIWLGGLAAGLGLTAFLLNRPEVAVILALLPVMAVVTAGWRTGLLVQAAIVPISVLLHYGSSGIVPAGYALTIGLGGAVGWFIGWLATGALITAVRWSLDSFAQARRRLADTRDQRLELKQVQEDLILANRELARLAERLKVLNLMAEEARLAKEQFVANVSHELRTPLNMVVGFSEMMIDSPQLYGTVMPPTLLADITTIHRNGQHLLDLVNDVLDLSQVDAGRMALTREPTALQEIIEAAVAAVQPMFDARSLTLDVDVPTDLPSVLCDSTRIRQVVLNLLSNAGRYTDSGGVVVGAHQCDDTSVVSVTDTGPGIAPEDLDRIFEPFGSIDGTIRGRHEGSGLGLSISKRFVEMHGGRMWLESGPGRGTTFYFSLPSDVAETSVSAGGDRDARSWFNPYEPYEARTRRSKAPVPDMVPRFVLLERGTTLGHLFSRYVEGIELFPVSTIDGAARELRRAPARALVVGATSPDLSDVSLEDLNQLPYGTPAIACWMPGQAQAAQKLGVVAYLVKPVDRQTLLQAVEQVAPEPNVILLVDDEPELLQLFARMLRSEIPDVEVLRATNGRQALRLMRERRPGLVILDLIMPEVDGFQVLQIARQDPDLRRIPVVIVSSRDTTIGNSLVAVTRSGGLSVRDLLGCVEAVSKVLGP